MATTGTAGAGFPVAAGEMRLLSEVISGTDAIPPIKARAPAAASRLNRRDLAWRRWTLATAAFSGVVVTDEKLETWVWAGLGMSDPADRPAATVAGTGVSDPMFAVAVLVSAGSAMVAASPGWAGSSAITA
jgi:predicted anti-sigma-YlaC factor YlaD